MFTHCLFGALMTRIGDWPCGPATKMSIVSLLEEANAMRPSGPLLAAPRAPRTLVMTLAASPMPLVEKISGQLERKDEMKKTREPSADQRGPIEVLR